MKGYLHRVMTLIIAVIVMMSAIFIVGTEDIHAASKKPVKVSVTSVKSIDYNTIQVKWKAAKYAKKYQVYRATSKNGKYRKVKTTTDRSYKNSGLITGKRYYYKVRAINGTKKGSYSTKKSAVPTLKKTYGIVSSSNGYNEATISWNKVNGASKYQVYRATSKSGKYSRIATTKTTKYVNKGIVTGKTYYYKVRAFRTVNKKNKYGAYSDSVSVKAKLGKVNQIKTYAITKDTIKISWPAVSGATSYKVYRMNADEGTYVPIGTVSKTNYISSGLDSGTTYYYKVRAYRGEAYSSFSDPVKGTTKLGKITSITVKSWENARIYLKWDAVDNATGYEIYRAEEVDGNYKKIETTKYNTYTDGCLVGGKAYYYKVRAYKGSIYSDFSSTVNAKATLSTVNNLKADKITADSISLSWGKVEGAEGYEIYRREYGESEYMKIDESIKTGYTDTGLTELVYYDYEVRAYCGDAFGGYDSLTYVMPKGEYSYELYTISGHELMNKGYDVSPYTKRYGDGTSRKTYGSNEYLMVVTDNPMTNMEISLYDVDQKAIIGNTGIVVYAKGYSDDGLTAHLDFPERPSDLVDFYYADMVSMPDEMSDGKYIYFISPSFSVSGVRNVKIVESVSYESGLGYYGKTVGYSEESWSLNVGNYYERYCKWLDEIIEKYTDDAMNAHEKMTAISEGLEEEATYNYYTKFETLYSTYSSFRLAATHKWEHYYWDSAFSPAILQDIGARLGYQVLDYKEAGKPYAYHAYVWGTYNGVEYMYNACPSTSTTPELAEYCPQITMEDFIKVPYN